MCELRFACKRLAARDVALFEATGANVHFALVAILYDRNTLNVGTELTVDRAERVRNGATGNGVLTAYLTYLGHDYSNLQWRRLGEEVATDAQTHKTNVLYHKLDSAQRPNWLPSPFAHIRAEQTSAKRDFTS